jgi:hypothetical protein
MQSKVGIASLLKQYKFTVSKKTMEPLKFKPRSLTPAAEGETDVKQLFPLKFSFKLYFVFDTIFNRAFSCT